MNNISILGCTGSIGTQALEVIRSINSGTRKFNVIGLTANTSLELLEKQIVEFKPRKVAIMDLECAEKAVTMFKKYGVKVLHGIDGIIEVATLSDVDTVINALVGNIGLMPTLKAIRSGKHVALANKETIVTAGELVMLEAKKANVNIYPVDSEHSAIFQCLQGNQENKINNIYLTASGGAFRGKTLKELKNVTLEDALKHPNWVMGNKITIDSATLMNKGLEVIEAKWLFDLKIDQIKVLIHPQSIIHSMVEYEDGAIMAQLGVPDMKVPIQYALTYPKRIGNSFGKLDFSKNNNLTFEQPDIEKFRCLQLSFDALQIGGTMPTVLNAANEVAVAKFLEQKISFLQIPELIESAMNAYIAKSDVKIEKYEYTIEDVLKADLWSRNYALNL